MVDEAQPQQLFKFKNFIRPDSVSSALDLMPRVPACQMQSNCEWPNMILKDCRFVSRPAAQHSKSGCTPAERRDLSVNYRLRATRELQTILDSGFVRDVAAQKQSIFQKGSLAKSQETSRLKRSLSPSAKYRLQLKYRPA